MKINQWHQNFNSKVTTSTELIDQIKEPVQTDGLSTSSLSEIEAIFEEHGHPLDDKMADEIEAFLETSEGSKASKIKAIEMALYKGIPITHENLADIHTALKGTLVQLFHETVPVMPALPKEGSLIKWVQSLTLDETVKNELVLKLEQGLFLEPEEKESLLKNFKFPTSEKSPNHSEPLPEMRTEPSESIEVHESKEVVVKNELPEGISEVENWVAEILENTASVYSDVMATFDVRQFVVEETTAATLEAKATFDVFQKESIKLLEEVPVQNKKEAANNIEKAIEGLNKVILKSNVSLFTDMKTERSLLVMGSKLEEARQALTNGAFEDAKTIVADVKKTLEAIVFKPSQIRVQAFATLKTHQVEAQFSERAKNTLDIKVHETLTFLQNEASGKSAKDVYELMRFMGLNHEVEVADLFESKSSGRSTDWMTENVKEILIKLMKEEVDSRAVDAHEEAMMNLSGQQMMNQSGQEQKNPFYYFNLPFEDEGTLNDMKITVKGARKGAGLDWKNTEVYFALTLKRYGEVGIKVKAKEGVCDVTVMTDYENALRPSFESAFEKLDELGYQKGTFSFKALDEKASDREQMPVVIKKGQPKPLPGKGFDFKI